MLCAHCRRHGLRPLRTASHARVVATDKEARACSRRVVVARAASGWPLWTVLSGCAAGAMVLEECTPVGGWVSGVVVAMLAAGVLAHFAVIPAACAEFGVIWDTVMPLGAALYMLEADVSRVWESGMAALAAFALGAFGTLCGTLIAWRAVGGYLGASGKVVVSALCASYVGGTVNFAAVVQSLKLQNVALVASAMAIDNVAMALYLAVLFCVPAASSAAPAARRAPPQHSPGSDNGVCSTSEPPPDISRTAPLSEPSPHALPPHVTTALSLAAAAGCCAAGEGIALALGVPDLSLALMTLAACAAASLLPRVAALALQQPRPVPLFAGSSAIARFLMMLFFTSIGAASAGGVHADSAALAAFVAIQLAVHVAVCLGGGLALRLPLDVVIIASNANVGGPGTAVAMAASRGWGHLVQTAMLLGALGYCVGTGLGLWVFTLLE